MKNAIILHGGPSKAEYYDPTSRSMSNAHWIPWLQAQLLKKDIPAATPEVPWSFDRNWRVWEKEVRRYDITEETILVGHSTGGGFFVKFLSLYPQIRVGRLVLVAPWLDPERTKTKHFFDDFTIDPDFPKRTSGVTIFNSDNDMESVQKSVRMIREGASPISYREFAGYGHFCYSDLKGETFPELLETAIS